MAGGMEATSAERQQREIRAMLADILAPNGRQQGADGPAKEDEDPRRAFVQALAKRALARQQEEKRDLAALSTVPEVPDEPVDTTAAHPPVASNGLPGASPEEAVLQRYEERVRRLHAETLARFKSSLGVLTEACLADLHRAAGRVAAQSPPSEQDTVSGP